MSKHKDKIVAAFRAMDERQLDEVPKYQSEDCSYRMNYDTVVGRAPFLEMIKGWYAAFPDLRHEILDYAEDGEHAAYTVRVTGTHTGTMQTPNGPVPATGKRVDFRALDHVTFGADGRACTWNAYFDMLTTLEQLGLV